MTERWLVVFTDLEPLPGGAGLWDRLVYRIYDRVLRPGFRHVFAVRPLPGGYLLVDPRSNGLNILALDGDAPLEPGSPYIGHDWYRGLVRSADRGTIAAAWVAENRDPTRSLPLRPPTCVAVIQALLGLDGRAITPFQLYRQLTKET